jgi:hypothetical protein
MAKWAKDVAVSEGAFFVDLIRLLLIGMTNRA